MLVRSWSFSCLTLQAHSCVEKAGMLSLVKMRELGIDDNFSLRGSVLQKAIEVSIMHIVTL